MKPLKRGRIASIDGEFGVGDLDDVTGQNSLNGQPSWAINICDRGTLPSGHRWAAGEMARRKEDRVEVPMISSDGDVSRTHEDDVIAEYSAFAFVPGKFAIAWSDWAFNHLVFNFPIWEWREQTVWLNGFYEETSFDNVSSVGFKHRPVDDGATKGTVHGSRVTDDEAIGADLRESTGSYLNELRYKHWWQSDHYGSLLIKAYIAASGYIQLYNPSDLTTSQYLEYVLQHVYPNTEDAEDDDVTDDDNDNDD